MYRLKAPKTLICELKLIDQLIKEANPWTRFIFTSCQNTKVIKHILLFNFTVHFKTVENLVPIRLGKLTFPLECRVRNILTSYPEFQPSPLVAYVDLKGPLDHVAVADTRRHRILRSLVNDRRRRLKFRLQIFSRHSLKLIVTVLHSVFFCK